MLTDPSGRFAFSLPGSPAGATRLRATPLLLRFLDVRITIGFIKTQSMQAKKFIPVKSSTKNAASTIQHFDR
jgi:hypothetical protein